MRCAGAWQVIGIDLISSRLAIAAQCGIDTQINLTQTQVTDQIKHLTGDTGCQWRLKPPEPDYWHCSLKNCCSVG